MIRDIIRMLAPIALLGIGTTAEAAKFAVRCSGTDFMDDNTSGALVSTKYALDGQVYVIDEDARQVLRAVDARKQLVDLCDVTKPSCEIKDASDYLETRGVAQKDGYTAAISFEYNKETGTALHEVNMDYDDGRYVHIRWQMNCQKAPIPTFGD